MHSNSTGCPKIISPVSPSFVLVIISDKHLVPESQKHVKNTDFHTAESVQIQAAFFPIIFRWIPIHWPLTYLLSSDFCFPAKVSTLVNWLTVLSASLAQLCFTGMQLSVYWLEKNCASRWHLRWRFCTSKSNSMRHLRTDVRNWEHWIWLQKDQQFSSCGRNSHIWWNEPSLWPWIWGKQTNLLA